MSVIYKRTERERDWETTSSRGGAGGAGVPQSYTTVRRYKVPDHSLEEDTYESEMRLVHRGRDDFEERRSTKEYIVERDAPPPPRSEIREFRYVDREPSPRGRDVHEYRIERHVERSPSPVTHREIRISRDYEREYEAPQREQPYDLERYSRSTEYFRPEAPPPQPQLQPQPIYIRNEAPAAPQPIIIREEAPQPIIIRERAPEPSYELIERAEITEDRQVARPRHEEDYYYERRVKEVDRGGRRDERYAEEREYGRDRYGEQNYYSDDDVVYVHKEKDTWGGRDSETRTKRDVAAGALAGIAAGQIVRHHRKRKGEAAGGNIGNALGYGTLGAVSAVALDKFNNRDRSRSMSSDRGRGRRDGRQRSRSRHRSKSRVKEISTLAAIAGVGALAYTIGQRNKKKNEAVTVIEESHRSRTRSRRGGRRSKSVTVIESGKGRSRSRSKHGRSRSRSKHTDPEHRNRRASQVGLATAAVAGVVSHRRSKSRKREGKRSPSRVRQGVPIAAAGVAGAAITGMYEKHKAKKEVRAASKERSRSRSRSVIDRLRGRSHSRSRSTVSEPVLVEYGGDPIYTDRARSRSHRRRRHSSSSSSRGRHGSRSRSRSKSRARSVAGTAAVAGVAGLAAHEAAKRRDKKKAEKERERRRESIPRHYRN